MPKQVIGTWKNAQALVPDILEKLNSDSPLLFAALANPLFALEELGYEIAPSFCQELTDRLRFSPRDSVRVRQLRDQIFEHAGRRFDLESPTEIENVLFEHLKLRRPPHSGGKRTLQAPLFRFRHEHEKDPLESLRGLHVAVDALLEFRKLDARAPKLAPRSLYNEIRSGKHALPMTHIHARLKKRDTPRDDRG